METSQIIFSVALGSITLLITFFALYVIWSTMWADRWVRTRPARPSRRDQ